MTARGKHEWIIWFFIALSACEGTTHTKNRTYADELGDAIYAQLNTVFGSMVSANVPKDLLHRISVCQARVYLSHVPPDRLAEMDADARGERTASEETRDIVEHIVGSEM